MEGNQMKMREVVKALLDVLYGMGVDEEMVVISVESTNCHMNSSKVLEIIRKAKAALSAPPRNCDVGTAEVQYTRWRRFCDSQKCCNNQCPVYKLADVCGSRARCNLIWAQMPYEEGGAE